MSEKKVFPPGADPGTDDEQITEVELEPVEQKNIVKFAIASLAGLFLFLIPIPRGTSFTIPIGILINWVSDLLELENVNLASVAVLLFITVSTVLTIINKLFHPAFLARNEKVEKIFSPAPLYFVSRILGLIIVYMAFFKVGPKMIWSGATGGSMLGVSATLISVILCIAFLMPLLTDFGIMEFVGVFMRKVVRPLFTVPGRSAIDLVTSWLGTSNAAAILTTGQYEAGFLQRQRSRYDLLQLFLCVHPLLLCHRNTAGGGGQVHRVLSDQSDRRCGPGHDHTQDPSTAFPAGQLR